MTELFDSLFQNKDKDTDKSQRIVKERTEREVKPLRLSVQKHPWACNDCPPGEKKDDDVDDDDDEDDDDDVNDDDDDDDNDNDNDYPFVEQKGEKECFINIEFVQFERLVFF